MHDHVPEFRQELGGIEEFGNDESAIKRRLNPSAPEDQDFEELFDAMGGG